MNPYKPIAGKAKQSNNRRVIIFVCTGLKKTSQQNNPKFLKYKLLITEETIFVIYSLR